MNAAARGRLAWANGAPLVFFVLIAALFGAAMMMEIDPAVSGKLLAETGGLLAVGLLLIGSAGGARSAHLLAAGRMRGTAALQAAAAAGQCLLAAVLLLPVMAEAWEWGSPPGTETDVLVGSAAAGILGISLGFLFGAVGFPPAAALLPAASTSALILWPASLGWAGLPGRFPHPETGVTALSLLVAAAILIGTIGLAVRGRKREDQ